MGESIACRLVVDLELRDGTEIEGAISLRFDTLIMAGATTLGWRRGYGFF